MTAIAAVDLGAASGRVVLGTMKAGRFTLHELHRFPNEPAMEGGVLRWRVDALVGEIVNGLRKAADASPSLDSVGIDGWGADYGLLDADGRLLGNPAHYRDTRTNDVVAQTLDQVGRSALYEATGTQLQPFNTVFQLLADRDTPPNRAAAHALLVPDLIRYLLTGADGTELTNASTTGLVDPRTSDWSRPLAERLGIPIELFGEFRVPGDAAGMLRPGVLAETGLCPSPPINVVPSHDTAAAVAGIPAANDEFAFVCTGTWALVGVELSAPVISVASREANFTNEIGVDGTIRFLRNVTGFWLLQECLREWERSGVRLSLESLTAAAAELPQLRWLVDVQDPSFLRPGNMPERISDATLRTNGVRAGTPTEITRCILDSMALAIRAAVHDASALSKRNVKVVHVVGGGAANNGFCQLLADACELPIVAGPVEAASWGNVLSQARAIGSVPDSFEAMRETIRHSVRLRRHEPTGSGERWDRAAAIIRDVALSPA
jgi:rhamnulokinase